MNSICYVGFYDVLEEGGAKRNIHLAGRNKMEYIISAVERCGANINVLSASQSIERKAYKSEKKKLSDKTTLFLPYSFGRGGNIRRLFNFISIRIHLLSFLLFCIKRESTVMVYHSLAYMNTISFAKKIRKFRLILEIEEIYGDVLKSEKTVNKEMKFFKKADEYIFPTELLNRKINTINKPYVIVHGTYKCEDDLGKSFNDDKIHVVYSGTFDPRKGGAAAAAAAAEWLPENYHIHIIGFGSKEDTEKIKNIIFDINNKSKATVTYDGRFLGKEYVAFLQKCQIGLSTQNPDADFNDTSFPSKILSYMANGLRVVSIKIPAIENSAIGKEIYYYDEQKPQKIANAIVNVDLNGYYNGKKAIMDLDKKFVKEVKKFLNE